MEPKQRPVLSIVIPARNRQIELENLVSIIDSCVSRNIEFIISDNSDSPLPITSSNPFCQIVRPNRSLNMTENWNFSFSHSSGKFISFLGDDDAFIPSELLRLADILVSEESDLVWYPRANYAWPQRKSPGNFYQEVTKKSKGSLEAQRRKVLNLDYSNLPIPYHSAIVHRRVFELHHKTTDGKEFFSTRNPDFNAGAKVLFLARTQLFYSRTVFISGASQTSNGGLNGSNPTHPRAQEYRDLTLNPPPPWMPQVNLPNGFIWLYEAVEDALLEVGVLRKPLEGRAYFLSVSRSQNPVLQWRILKKMWPQFRFLGALAVPLGQLRGILSKTGVTTLWSYLQILFRVSSGASEVRSIKGPSIMVSTVKLVAFLESTKILDNPPRLLVVKA